MNYTGGSGSLAATGAGAITVGGIAFQQLWLLALAVLIVIGGAVLVRTSYRRNKGVSEV
ncbi:hypothetical protein ACWD0A_18320 [Streptomyces sp. NPDC002867]|uniref:hypothetical protein n=1 Tax=unclassified Streptomyces TaxID=2593676 RepID=UPI0015A36857|nr:MULTISPECIES: hypothetical protein [unclassified Streptomyces]MDQ1011036.1 hypothetical protein [Streptomyces sp. V4I23]NWF27524.1 hypothetical protein [Streptomyces sp. PKU-EA00015]